MTESLPTNFPIAVGCGAPTPFMLLTALARASCWLVNPDSQPAVVARWYSRLLEAITPEPVVVSGEDRICAVGAVRCGSEVSSSW